MHQSTWQRLGTSLILCLGVLTSASAQVVDSVNVGKTPIASQWNVGDVGWLYTPSFGYDLGGIETLFPTGLENHHNVTVELYDELPSAGGVLLRSAMFVSEANVFSGGSFTPISLVANEDYFVGFRNVANLGPNITRDPGATLLSRLYLSDDGSYQYTLDDLHSAPILRFLAPPAPAAPAPEPTSITLLGLGALPLLRRLRRRMS